MPENSYPNYLRSLEELVSERRALKARAADEYRQTKDAVSSAEDELAFVKAEYEPLGSVLEPLQVERSELKEEIRDTNIQKGTLEKELARITEESTRVTEQLKRTSEELKRLEKEVEPLRKEIASLQRQTKPVRNRIHELGQKVSQLQKQRDEARQRLEAAQNAFSESNHQYLLALQWEKRKPLITVAGLALLFVAIFVTSVWAAKQLPILGLVTVIIATFLVFFTIVITLLRQDEKLREENFVRLARDILKYLRLVRQ